MKLILTGISHFKKFQHNLSLSFGFPGYPAQELKTLNQLHEFENELRNRIPPTSYQPSEEVIQESNNCVTFKPIKIPTGRTKLASLAYEVEIGKLVTSKKMNPEEKTRATRRENPRKEILTVLPWKRLSNYLFKL